MTVGGGVGRGGVGWRGRGIIEAITIISFWMAANSIDLSGKLADYSRLQNIGWQKNVAHLANCHYSFTYNCTKAAERILLYCGIICLCKIPVLM
jgi:hypothetical protein